LMDYMGIGVIAVSAGLSLSACVALLLLKARPANSSTLTSLEQSPIRSSSS